MKDILTAGPFSASFQEVPANCLQGNKIIANVGSFPLFLPSCLMLRFNIVHYELLCILKYIYIYLFISKETTDDNIKLGECRQPTLFVIFKVYCAVMSNLIGI